MLADRASRQLRLVTAVLGEPGNGPTTVIGQQLPPLSDTGPSPATIDAGQLHRRDI